jgi:hypothetical protein
LPCVVSHFSSPIRWQDALIDVAMEAAMRPIAHLLDEAVLHGIKVYVVSVALQIRIIANCVLPVAALPNALLVLDLLIERAPASKPREKPPLIRFHRDEKSMSSSGWAQIACRWSGKMQIATVSNGRR